jgi:hypothetical protein
MRLLLLCALVASLVAAPAQAYNPDRLADGSPRSHTSRVHNMRLIARDVYGPDVCGDTMTVPIMHGPMLQPLWAAYAHHEDAPMPWSDCRIVLADMPWTTEYLCRVILHEYGHLSGYKAPEGKEYIRPDGTPDYDHSNDPQNLMWPFVIDFYAPCADGAADTR